MQSNIKYQNDVAEHRIKAVKWPSELTLRFSTLIGSLTIRLGLSDVGVDGIDDGGEVRGDEKPLLMAVGVNAYEF